MSWDLIGHEWAVRMLKQHIADDRVRHAYLFVGPDSVGKRLLALRFAQALSCLRARSPDEMCDLEECRACRLIPERTHPDLELVAPDISIQVDEVRELQHRLALLPYEAPRKIALLSDFDRATRSAANAMLKTLEEPPSQVVILLTSTAEEALLPTVVSRCEVVRLRTVPADTIAASLHDRGTDAEAAELFTSLAAGRPGRAIQFAQDPAYLESRTEALDRLGEVLASDIGERFSGVGGLIGKGKLPVQRRRMQALLEEWIGAWTDLLYVGYDASRRPRNPDRMAELEQAVEAVPPMERYRVVASIARTREAIDSNANLRLALESLMLDLPRTEQ